jgi:polyferredoxin
VAIRLDLFLPYQKKPNALRRLLGKLGATWASSPLRRVVQGVCFVVFLILFFYVCWPYGSHHYATHLAGKEKIPAEAFLALDPLVSLSTALAARTWVFSLGWAAVMLGVCLIFPRGFCGYICPLGTLIDLFDWSVSNRVRRFRAVRDGWWIHLKYYLLSTVLLASLCGVLLSGFVAAIPVITRGLQFILSPVQMGGIKGWYLVPPMNAGHLFSIALFILVLALGLLRPRFWCRYVCPTGAIFSVCNLFRATERQVEATCIECDKCARICPFDAIQPTDYTTRTADCTLCQTCAGVCPTHSIKFVPRWNSVDLKTPVMEPAALPLSRRNLLGGAISGAAVAAGIRLAPTPSIPPVRPPGSVPETDFLQLCIRCGECFRVCPNNVLQPIGFEKGINNLWTPQVVANWSGCEPSCNNCGQVCPTAAIRALPIAEKRAARMGLAIINEQTCLPHAQREACQMCVDECTRAGYNALEFRRVGVRMDGDGNPIEDSGFLAPVILPDQCIGCGLCQTRCHLINVKQKHLLPHTAIEVLAGDGREDRLRRGSYIALREKERAEKPNRLSPPTTRGTGGDYLPDFLK